MSTPPTYLHVSAVQTYPLIIFVAASLTATHHNHICIQLSNLVCRWCQPQDTWQVACSLPVNCRNLLLPWQLSFMRNSHLIFQPISAFTLHTSVWLNPWPCKYVACKHEPGGVNDLTSNLMHLYSPGKQMKRGTK